MSVDMRYGAGNGSGSRARISLLWSNTDTTVAFGAQTVTLAGPVSDYDIICVSYFFSTGTQTLGSALFMAADLLDGTTAGLRINAGSANRTGARTFTVPTAGTVNFDSASYNGGTSNSNVIPAAIYGIKL